VLAVILDDGSMRTGRIVTVPGVREALGQAPT
jgi:hypothetical protein